MQLSEMPGPVSQSRQKTSKGQRSSLRGYKPAPSGNESSCFPPEGCSSFTRKPEEMNVS
jgi:hypothetical protein